MNEVTTVAREFTALCARGDLAEAARRYWADDVVSREPFSGPLAETRGRAAVEAKQAWWSERNTIHGVAVAGPLIHGDQFAVRFSLDCTPEGGERAMMEEVAIYTVREGKIIEERFFMQG